MRLANLDGRSVMLVDGQAVDVAELSGGRFGPDPQSVFRRWDAFAVWARGVGVSGGSEGVRPRSPSSASTPGSGAPVDPSRLGNPVPSPSQVFAIGANYAKHVAEAGAEVPERPLVFTKFPSCLAGPRDPILVSTPNVDWEVELVVVIGRAADRVEAGHGWEHVAGLTVGQDISDRVLQMDGVHPQFSLAKSYTSFGPVGPVVATPDEFEDPDDLEIGCELNGEPQQRSRTSDLVFSVPFLVEYLSSFCRLNPGDLIFTGTPEGVGAFRSPPRFLREGDLLTSWVAGVGELSNRVVSGAGQVTGSSSTKD